MRGMWHPSRFDDPKVFDEYNITVLFSSSCSFFLSTVFLVHRFQTSPVHVLGRKMNGVDSSTWTDEMETCVMYCIRFGMGNGKADNSEPGDNYNYTNFTCSLLLRVCYCGWKFFLGWVDLVRSCVFLLYMLRSIVRFRLPAHAVMLFMCVCCLLYSTSNIACCTGIIQGWAKAGLQLFVWKKTRRLWLLQ